MNANKQDVGGDAEDARRYRWLRANCEVNGPEWVYWHDDDQCTPLDERIDAALALIDGQPLASGGVNG